MKHLIPLLIVLFIANSCKKKEPAPICSTPDIEVPPIDTTGQEPYLTGTSDYIFDQDKLATYELILPEESLQFIDDDPAAEEYVEGMLVFEGDTISPVGIRYKGSIGAYVNCLSGNNWANPSGFKTCTKLSMKVKINWEGRDVKFYGLKKLQFHAMNLDNSQMRDRLGYWLFREMGVPSPRAVHARLLVNNQYVGVFSLVEQIDGRFTDYHFDDGDGNLYKEIWPLTSDGNAFEEQDYLQNLKTNEDDNPSAAIIRNFAIALENSSDDNLKQTIADHMDIDEIISYAVVDRAIRHDDGPFHFYCGGGDCTSHNFYWYETPGDENLHLIAWDLDNAFENISGINPVTNIPDEWGETSNNCQPFSSGFFGLQQRSAACDKLVKGWTMYEDEYEQIKLQLKQGPLNIANANMMLDKWDAQIRDATLEASEEHDDAISVDQWEQAMGVLRMQLEVARSN